jgi:hypothetical protein
LSEERISPEPGDDAEDLGILDDLLGIAPDEPDTEPQEQEPVDGGEEAPAQEPQQPRRENRTIRALRARLKTDQDEKAQLRRQIDQLLSQTRPPPAPAPDPYRQAEFVRQEQERLAMMQPHEIAAYTEQKLRNEFNQQLMNGQMQTRDLIDRQMYDQLKTRDSLAERFSGQVEDLLAAARSQGMNPTREVLLNALVGQEFRQKAQRQIETARRRGARQIAAQTTQPGGGRNGAADTRRTRREDPEAGLDERLRSVTIGEAW